MPLLFEFHNEAEIEDAESLKKYLDLVWKDQYNSLYTNQTEEDIINEDDKIKRSPQPFLQFNGNFIRAKNYVGFIQHGGNHIEIYPKVFKHKAAQPVLMLKHLFFWFDYCRKWKFPLTKSNLDTLDKVELPELIIYLMASKMLETVSQLPISLYQPVEESLYSPKGRINFGRYLSSGFVNGNQHIIDCDHEPFLFDNKLNRIIKYVARLLINKTKFAENQSLLQELIFILDEVEDHPCSFNDLETIVFNPLFSEYSEIKEICKIVLQELMYSNQQYDLSQWSLLFRMEYIFEDFIAGLIETKFSDKWKVEYQKSNMNLCNEPQAFKMQHDIYLTLRADPSKTIIVDTKYKLREVNFKADKKKGISQTDIYQVVSYAVKRGCTNVLLLYPNIDTVLNPPDFFTIGSGFAGKENIYLMAVEVPFWSIDHFDSLESHLTTVLNRTLEFYEYDSSST